MSFSTSILLGLSIGLGIAIISWLKRREHYQALVSKIGDFPFRAVRYSKDARYSTWFKLFPCDGEALLVFKDSSIQLVPYSASKESSIISIAKNDCSFIGCPDSIKNGYLSWIRYKVNGELLYITSETGPFIFSSHLQTTALFSSLRGNTEQGAAANPYPLRGQG